MTWLQQTGEFRLGDFTVQSGETIRDARLVWKSHGALSPQRDNVVLYPCSYGAKHEDLEWLIGPDRILDPTRWFIVIPNMFSNGVSSGGGGGDAGLSAPRDLMGQRPGAAAAARRAVRRA